MIQCVLHFFFFQIWAHMKVTRIESWILITARNPKWFRNPQWFRKSLPHILGFFWYWESITSTNHFNLRFSKNLSVHIYCLLNSSSSGRKSTKDIGSCMWICLCCSVLRRVAVCCSVLQRVAACCSVLPSLKISGIKASKDYKLPHIHMRPTQTWGMTHTWDMSQS